MARRIMTLLAGLAVCWACSSSAEKAEKAAPVKPTEQAPKSAAQRTAVAPLEAPKAAPIDPARVPVEEDFSQAADDKISKNANLPLEIERLSKEIEKARQK